MPNGYGTETPEHLHVMYVKIPWCMSNHHHLLPQMVGYLRCLEALEIHQVYIKDYYREDLDFDIRDIVFKDELIGSQSGDNSEYGDNINENMDNDRELEDPVQIPLGN
ncbi:hypothetical protein RhiLY_00314 [Ceratobasidium sp. AG-Ba]|nr:hypothetical protein RhiLY_00314 [Ceratobasidium sp. AG-Ba]